jgi:hypothetical protein
LDFPVYIVHFVAVPSFPIKQNVMCRQTQYNVLPKHKGGAYDASHPENTTITFSQALPKFVIFKAVSLMVYHP